MKRGKLKETLKYTPDDKEIAIVSRGGGLTYDLIDAVEFEEGIVLTGKVVLDFEPTPS